MMYNIIKELTIGLFFFLTAFVIHELGHIVAFYLLTKKLPPIRFKKGIVQVGDAKYIKDNNITLRWIMHVSLMGILWGALYLAVFANKYPEIMTVYVLASSIDISNVVQYFSSEKKTRDIPLKYFKVVINDKKNNKKIVTSPYS